jgi:hypothetical protein
MPIYYFYVLHLKDLNQLKVFYFLPYVKLIYNFSSQAFEFDPSHDQNHFYDILQFYLNEYTFHQILAVMAG